MDFDYLKTFAGLPTVGDLPAGRNNLMAADSKSVIHAA